MKSLVDPLIRSLSIPGLCLLLSLVACAPVQSPFGDPVENTVGEALMARWHRTVDEVRTVQGIAKVKVSTPQGGGGGTQILLAEKPARVRAETLSPFGTPILTLASDGEMLGVLAPTINSFYRGAPTAENIGRFTRIPLRPEDLVNLLLHQPPLIDETYTVFHGPEKGWLLLFETDGRTQEMLFDSDGNLVEVRYSRYNRLLIKMEYGDFSAENGFPWSYGLALPEYEMTASLKFSELTLNRDFQPGIFVIEPPKGVIIHELDQD